MSHFPSDDPVRPGTGYVDYSNRFDTQFQTLLSFPMSGPDGPLSVKETYQAMNNLNEYMFEHRVLPLDHTFHFKISVNGFLKIRCEVNALAGVAVDLLDEPGFYVRGYRWPDSDMPLSAVLNVLHATEQRILADQRSHWHAQTIGYDLDYYEGVDDAFMMLRTNKPSDITFSNVLDWVNAVRNDYLRRQQGGHMDLIIYSDRSRRSEFSFGDLEVSSPGHSLNAITDGGGPVYNADVS